MTIFLLYLYSFIAAFTERAQHIECESGTTLFSIFFLEIFKVALTTTHVYVHDIRRLDSDQI